MATKINHLTILTHWQKSQSIVGFLFQFYVLLYPFAVDNQPSWKTCWTVLSWSQTREPYHPWNMQWKKFHKQKICTQIIYLPDSRNDWKQSKILDKSIIKQQRLKAIRKCQGMCRRKKFQCEKCVVFQCIDSHFSCLHISVYIPCRMSGQTFTKNEC